MNARADLDAIDERLYAIPRSPEAEQSVLGGLLIDNEAWDRVADLIDSRHFFEQRHRHIFDAIGGLVNANKPADTVTVLERLEASGKAMEVGGLPYLEALAQSVPSARNARRYAEIVRDKALHRALIAATDEAGTIARSEDPAPQKADRIAALLDQVQREQVVHKPRTAAELAVDRIDHYNAQAQGDVPTGAPTGIAELDAALSGGLQEGRVYVLAARPSIGKTSLAMQIALHRAKAGEGVLVLSQEMPAEECIDRAVCNLGGVDYGRLQRAQLQDDDWRGTTEAVELLSKLPLWIDDQPGVTIGDIRGKAMSLRRSGLKLLVIDYLQLCTGSHPGRGVTRNSELEEICRGLKSLAKQLRISVLLLSQLSREVEKRATPEPNLGDLRDSGAIEQDADCVLFLWFVRAWTDRKFIGLGIAKNRQGQTGQRIALEFRGQFQRWNDSDADISPQQKRAAPTQEL